MVDAVTNSSPPAPLSVVNRYGTPKRKMSTRRKLIIVGTVAIVALAWILWTVVGGGPATTQKVLSYNVSDATQTSVEMTMTKDRNVTAQCAVQALNSTYAVVGWKVITIGPTTAEQGRTTTVNTILRTDSLAVTGVVDSCWAVK